MKTQLHKQETAIHAIHIPPLPSLLPPPKKIPASLPIPSVFSRAPSHEGQLSVISQPAAVDHKPPSVTRQHPKSRHWVWVQTLVPFLFLGGGVQTKMSWRSPLTSQYSR